MKIRPVGAELFHEDRRTDRDMTKLTVSSHNVVTRLKMNGLLPQRQLYIYIFMTCTDTNVNFLMLQFALNP